MGAVYRARHLLIDRVVAIKILQPERRGEEHFRAWFLREARAVNRINHANIVDINDFGETEDGLAYLVMELLVGEALSNIIMRGAGTQTSSARRQASAVETAGKFPSMSTSSTVPRTATTRPETARRSRTVEPQRLASANHARLANPEPTGAHPARIC